MGRTLKGVVAVVLGAGALELAAGTGATAAWVPGTPVPPGWVVLAEGGAAVPPGEGRIQDLRGADPGETVTFAGISSLPPGWVVVECWSRIQERPGPQGFFHRYVIEGRIRNLKGAPLGSREIICLNPPVPAGWEIVGGALLGTGPLTFLIEKRYDADGDLAGENLASPLTGSPEADYVLEDLAWSND